MKCSKCRREFTPSPASETAIRLAARLNKVPLNALRVVCPKCVEETAKKKETAK